MMDFSRHVDRISTIAHFVIEGITCRNFWIMMNFCHEDLVIFANSADPDEMPRYVAFHLDLLLFAKVPFCR